MLKYLFWTVIGLPLISIQVSILKQPNFENWKQNSIEIVERNCEKAEKKNLFYKDECAFVKRSIELITVSDMDQVYQEAVKIASEFMNAHLKYYIHYYVSGEVDDIQQYFIFQLQSKEILVVNYSSFSEQFSKSTHRNIPKKIYCPKQDFSLKSENCDHSAIVTTFKKLQIVRNEVLICPKDSFYHSLTSLLEN